MALISNNEIKKVRSLQQKKFRDETGLFIAEGEKIVEEALASSFEVEKIYRRSEVGDEAMGRISALVSPSPVLAVVRKPSDTYVSDVNSQGYVANPKCKGRLKCNHRHFQFQVKEKLCLSPKAPNI